MKRFRQSAKPRLAQSGMGNDDWINYERAGKENPNYINTGKGRVNKKRVLQLRYLQSKTIVGKRNKL